MQYKRRRSSAIGLLSIAIVASLLCLNKLVNFIIPIDDDTYLQSYQRQLLIDNDLLTTLHTNCNYNNNETDEDYNLEAANAANLAITEDSQKKEKANMFQMAYTANVLEHPNMASAATRQLADPQTQKKVVADVGISNAQMNMLG